MPSGVAAKATDSWSTTDTSPQPLLAPSAAVDPANQPTPGAQPTCENTHTRQGQENRAWVAAHLSSRPTLLLPKDAPPADFPFDAAGSPDATRGATPARTRMASATCPTRILGCPCLAIPECHRCERGAARGNSSLLQSPAAGVDSHAPVDSETQILIHLHPAECGIVSVG